MAELRYPKYDLEQSIEVASKIADRGVGATLTSPELAALLGYSGTNNGAYLNRIAAARLFGLIEGQGETIRVTDRAEQLLHPEYPEFADRARIEAFKAIPLYGAFLDAFRARTLPDRDGMMNALTTRFRVAPNEAGKVLGRLLLSAQQAGLFKVGGPSRMIEPSISASPSRADAEMPPAQASRQEARAALEATRRFPKIIDGALELMPAGPPWEESEYSEWLKFFDQACRVYYRIPRGGGSNS